ncbi:PAS domain-containing hybrid sensor histidine kinase/response regulator [Sphingomonas nostoxanthinifaciens]|uniref:PAS domain-containing hybrid sensor histidine kinase/response regulator n=1 Tax=Sphingomonas nostoxanthinifaciens TaxID=2872652 RepID=UPI001CC1DDC9|nr:PAS domain-containing hybrid sensor histidine kinase/response regulator [Sphingomonas nostoxanthinifaciens]UAK23867.1 response regulator [Sphingomonas nostoxanthinifaciens]
MGHRTAEEGYKVLIAAPFGRDAESLRHVLAEQGYDASSYQGQESLAAAFDDRAGVVLVTEEALRGDVTTLRAALDAQPAWSDIPFVVLAAQRTGSTRRDEATRAALVGLVNNAIVLERPIGTASLTSAIASAMRSRQKQFEMRDRLAELAESAGSLRLATSAANIGTWDYHPATDILRWDDRCKELFGLPPSASVTLDGTFYPGVHADDRDDVAEAVTQAMDPGGSGEYDIEYRTVGLEDGKERWVAARGRSVFDNGVVLRFIGTIIDITARKNTELALATSERFLKSEREELDCLAQTLEQKVIARTAELEAEMASRTAVEAALRQSQKMEAVGQLTGGIAHDFNNMLTGVIGAMDIMKRRLAAGRTDDLPRFMDAAATSAQRAAALTARLLAFSRRQSLDAKPTDTNTLILSFEELLRRTIRENIALRIVPGDDVPPAIVDANQLENAILNLAINARDAMPDGGQLTIETRTVELDEAYATAKPEAKPGRYVVVAVSDTGVGMTPEVLEKVFDPFFTTKPIGQGTGLGMSMVYGFARQSGGQVRVHSQPGVGTTVSIYLAAGEAAAPEQAMEVGSTPEGRGQTVLLVEDDPSVRLLVRDVLEELSYTAIEAQEADSALPILTSEQKIDLMISDVGLPGMNGRQLAEEARKHRPELPVLFVTGYAENAAIRAGFLGTNMAMITKPFSLDDLAGKIAEMLAQPCSTPDREPTIAAR